VNVLAVTDMYPSNGQDDTLYVTYILPQSFKRKELGEESNVSR
jgi:hypothetical protein